VDRARFCLDDQGNQIPQTSATEMIASMLHLLDVQHGNRVLEIGTGSGYSSALLAELTGPSGSISGMDVDPLMTQRASRLLRAEGYENVFLINADGQEGWPEHAPFDRIIAWASVTEVPAAWREQARSSAVLVIPMRENGKSWVGKYLKTRRGSMVEVERVPGGFIPLTPTPFRPWEAAGQ
jgi:protein-L-isoaspartate(D-aspartate) O-methyltransferase